MATKMIFKDKSESGGTVVSVDKAVTTCFRDLGHGNQTHGALNHEIQAYVMSMMPTFILSGVGQGIKKEDVEEALRKEQ